MKLALKILSGPLETRFAPIKAGQSIGRSGVDLKVPDTQIAQVHAIIEEVGPDEFVLKSHSPNCEISAYGKFSLEIKLEPGTQFQLGQTRFEVGELSADKKKYIAHPDPGSMEVELVQQDWNDYFSEFCAQQLEIEDRPRKMFSYPKILELHFLRGPLQDQKVIMAYGPRVLGGDNLEFPLFSEDLPEDLLSIDAKAEDLYVKTRYPKLVKLNSESIMSKKITHGDILEFADQRILLSLREPND